MIPFLERIDAEGRDLAPAADLAANLAADLARGEALHRAFRPRIGDDYAALMATVASEGGHLAQLVDEGEVRAIALWRVFHTTYCGRRLEVEDLVTDEAHRSKGYGATMLGWLEAKGVSLGCPTITLHSATFRTRAHGFYFRHGMPIIAFHFSKDLPPG